MPRRDPHVGRRVPVPRCSSSGDDHVGLSGCWWRCHAGAGSSVTPGCWILFTPAPGSRVVLTCRGCFLVCRLHVRRRPRPSPRSLGFPLAGAATWMLRMTTFDNWSRSPVERSLLWALQSSFKGRVSAFPPVLLGRVRFLSTSGGSLIALQSGGCWRTTRTSRNDDGWGVMEFRGWPRFAVEETSAVCTTGRSKKRGGVDL